MSTSRSSPAISVILPVRDGMPYLPETLASIGEQIFEDYEFLVQDDGSTDGSLECAQEFARQDPRVLVEALEPRGVAHAANAAARRARGRLHVRCDSDDISAPVRLASLAAFADDHPEVGLFGSRVRFFPRDGLSAGMQRYEDWINGLLSHDEIMRDRFVELGIAQPSWAMRPDVFERVGGYRQGLFPEDYDFFLRAIEAGVRFGKHPDTLVHWREHPDRHSRNAEAFSLERFFERKLEAVLPFLRERGAPLAIAGAGKLGKRWARRLGEAGLDVRYFLDVHPRRIGQTVHGAEVIGYEEVPRTRGCYVLVSVGAPDGREDVRRRLEAAGRVEETDFLSIQ